MHDGLKFVRHMFILSSLDFQVKEIELCANLLLEVGIYKLLEPH